MSEKLGFTFYPKDWWTSDSFHELEAKEKYVYLECLFLMYDNGDGYMNYTKSQLEKRFSVKLSEDEFNRITGRFIKDENGYTSLTVNKRMRKAIASRENGKNGGRPKKDDVEKTQKTQEKNLKKPALEREREREREKKDMAENLPTQKNDFLIREQRFYQSLTKYVETYGKDMVRKFYDYWREPNKSKSKMRWEQERTWDLGLRLKKWETNDLKFNVGKQNYQSVSETSKMVM